MDPELEEIIRQFKELRSQVPPDELSSFDEMMLRAINANTPAQRMEILDALVDPKGSCRALRETSILLPQQVMN